MSVYEVLIPTKDNNGDSIPSDITDDLESVLIDRFGGFTDAGLVRGAWVDAGVIFRDVNRKYEIASDSRAAIIAFAAHARRACDQRAIYVRMPDGRAEFVTA